MNSTSTSSEPGKVGGHSVNHAKPAQRPAEPAVTIAAQAAEQLPQHPRPTLEQGYTRHGLVPSPGQVVVINGQAALTAVSTHSLSNTQSELGGVLLGHAYQDNGTLFVEVEAALPAVSDDHGPVHFTFNANGWAQLHKDRAARYPDLQIVGWFHTHPNLGVFYSGDDVVVHSAAFTQPWHVGLVVDPVRREACYFGWQGDTLAPIAGFYERHDQQEASVINWRTVRTSVWGASYGQSVATAVSQSYAQMQTYAEESELPELPRWTSYVSLLVGIVGFMMSALLLFGYVVPQARQIEALQDTVLTLVEQAPSSNVAACPDPNLRILTPLTGTQVITGTAVSFVGTTNHPEASRYRLQVRLLDSNLWNDVAFSRAETTLGEIMTWDTTDVIPGTYVAALTAVDNNNISLPTVAPCQLQLELLPVPGN